MSILKLKTRAVIFDMDGVITNTMPDHFKAWKTIFAQEGIRVSRLDVYKREGQKGIDSVREIFTEYGKPFSREEAKKILKRKEKLFKRIVRRRFIPGSRNFLHHLHQKGFLLALVTGTSRHEVELMLPESTRGLFAVMVTGTDVKQGKPHPEPFLKALKKLRLKATEGVVIENAPFGIRSAKAARLRCLAVETSLPREYLKKANAVFSSVKDLECHVKFVYNDQ